ncbi:MAG: hypothetical protein ACJ787_18080, partial [Myxococcales bacterium]
MDIDVFPADEISDVFRALRTALNPAAPLQPAERKFLETYSVITGHPLQAGDPDLISPQEVRVEGAKARKRLIQLTAMAALLNHPLRPGSVRFVKELATAIGASDPVIPVLEAVLAGHPLRARFLSMRRWARVFLKEAYESEGIAGIARFFAAS